MREWMNPWPAISDLFSALLIATFGGLMLFMSKPADQPGDVNDPVDEATKSLQELVQRSLQDELKGEWKDCDGDVCGTVDIQFDTKKYDVTEDDKRRIGKASQTLRKAVESKAFDPAELEIVIEGHADERPLRDARTERDQFLGNWELSSKRASSVLYEFHQSGISPPEYRILAVGFGHSRPLCTERTSACWEKNRRTTFRLRPDRAAIKERLDKAKIR